MRYIKQSVESSVDFTITLNKLHFPILDYSKDSDGEFTGDLIETYQNTVLFLNTTLFKALYGLYTSIYNNIEFYEQVITHRIAHLKINFIAISENDEIIISLKK